MSQSRSGEGSPPTIGRIVHYVSYGTPGGEFTSTCRAAVVTEAGVAADSQAVGLCVLSPQGQFFNRAIPHDEDEKAGGTWHWPCVITTDTTGGQG